jgi:hypothetical protein
MAMTTHLWKEKDDDRLSSSCGERKMLQILPIETNEAK